MTIPVISHKLHGASQDIQYAIRTYFALLKVTSTSLSFNAPDLAAMLDISKDKLSDYLRILDKHNFIKLNGPHYFELLSTRQIPAFIDMDIPEKIKCFLAIITMNYKEYCEIPKSRFYSDTTNECVLTGLSHTQIVTLKKWMDANNYTKLHSLFTPIDYVSKDLTTLKPMKQATKNVQHSNDDAVSDSNDVRYDTLMKQVDMLTQKVAALEARIQKAPTLDSIFTNIKDMRSQGLQPIRFAGYHPA